MPHEKRQFCDTCCRKHGSTYEMSESEARMHVDSHPGHEIISVTQEGFDVAERIA